METVKYPECQAARFIGEPFEDYFVRLFENKGDYGLTCEDIKDLLNREQNVNYTESAWRKEYAAFRRGQIYERKKRESGVHQRILCISDTHVPFQLPVETFEKYAGLCDLLVLNGDIGDCQAISKFPKTYRFSPMQELIATRQYLIDLISFIRPKKVLVTYGNHDIRFQQYIAKNLDTDLIELMPKTSLEYIIEDGFTWYDKRNGTKTRYEPLKEQFEDIEIDYVDNWFCKVGSVIFCHPMAFASTPMKTSVNATNWFRNEGYDFKTLVMAHTHRVGFYEVGDTALYEQGCACRTEEMKYADGRLVNSQKKGYLYLCLDRDGNEIRELTHLEKLD